MPPYNLGYMQEREQCRRKREIDRQNADVMEDIGVRVEHFGPHWNWIADLRRAQQWGVGSFSQACWFFSKLQGQAMSPTLVKKKHLLKAINVPFPRHGDRQRKWDKRVRKQIRKLFRKLQKKSTRKAIVRREDRDSEEPVDATDPPSVIVGDQIQRYDNIVVTQSFLGPFDLATGQVDTLRQDPGDSIHQVHLHFPGGQQYYPRFLVCPSTRERANLEVPAMVFDIAAQVAQIPSSVPANIKQTVIDAIKCTDLRWKPSSLGFAERIRAAAMTDDEKVSAVDVVHAMAHAHWHVAPKGAYAFLYQHLRVLGIKDVVNYEFNWGNIRGTTVLDDQGRAMRITTNPPPTTRKVAPHLRKKFQDTKEGKKLLGEKVFTYHGTDADGKYVYRTHYDTFIGTQNHIDQILDQQQNILDERYAAQSVAQANIDNHVQASAIGEVSDDEGEPMAP